ncbi:hypothetical protein DICPUDRAFT_158344 [Dictyostelium purpureum]|uniref:Carbohydrate binding domain-containing protein n=1 Tax=Dictyostelium purpureum TaxID=5786 RepID=F1A1D5_DICPU|nr:uncharacterized protein DICPUDRAFT_158344 [Dictyostelium purpureum]EGC29999.1 hypothetical protein DICPUDRAFT_158344 [Dictyostelium purpureum]|eukprot:XP_003293483.1 hypothetical protein DICPUDRAFT_158344 [Dictyostelium purpureum]
MNTKLLITYFIFFITFSNAISINVDSIPSNYMHKRQEGGCKPVKGFMANYEAVGAQMNLLSTSYLIPYTFSEHGTFIVDYENDLAVWDFNNTADGGNLKGTLYAFHSNRTQYAYVNIGGVEKCAPAPMQFNLLENIALSKKVGSTLVGSHKLDIYENFTPLYNFTEQVSIYDPKDCSLVSTVITNNVLYQGKAIYNFFNYRPQVDLSRTQAPSVCFV